MNHQKIMTVVLVDENYINVTHDKISKIITLDIDEISVTIKVVPTLEVSGDTFQIRVPIYNIDVDVNAYDVDRQKFIKVKEHLTATDLLDWDVSMIELNKLNSLNSIESMDIDFINKTIDLNNV